MGIFDRLFGANSPKKERTLHDDFKSTAGPLVVNAYRRIAAERGCAPGPGISDEDILVVYEMVLSTFQKVARERGEHLPAAILNNIALIFLQKYQMIGQGNVQFFTEHVGYEAIKYHKKVCATTTEKNLLYLIDLASRLYGTRKCLSHSNTQIPSSSRI